MVGGSHGVAIKKLRFISCVLERRINLPTDYKLEGGIFILHLVLILPRSGQSESIYEP